MNPVQKVLEDADMKKSGIDEIVLVGGSTRIPKIRQLVKAFFNGKEPFSHINPEEAVAYGAAIQAGILSGQENTGSLILLDVCPLTLGVETEGGNMSEIIRRNTVVPVSTTELFTTTKDHQTVVTIKVFEGEHSLTKHNNLLASFDLTGISPAPKGKAKIKVTFEIDVNGILNVTAEARSGLFQTTKKKITVTNDHNHLSQEDIEWMVKDAQRFAEEDKKLTECITARNELENYTYSLKNQLGDQQRLGSKLSDTDRETIEKAVQEMIEWMDLYPKANILTLKAKKRALQNVVEPITGMHYGCAGIPCPEEDTQEVKDEL